LTDSGARLKTVETVQKHSETARLHPVETG